MYRRFRGKIHSTTFVQTGKYFSPDSWLCRTGRKVQLGRLYGLFCVGEDPLRRAREFSSAIAELERNLIMRRARLEGRHIGRKPLELDAQAILSDRARGQSLAQLAKGHRVSRSTIHRLLQEHDQQKTA